MCNLLKSSYGRRDRKKFHYHRNRSSLIAKSASWWWPYCAPCRSYFRLKLDCSKHYLKHIVCDVVEYANCCWHSLVCIEEIFPTHWSVAQEKSRLLPDVLAEACREPIKADIKKKCHEIHNGCIGDEDPQWMCWECRKQPESLRCIAWVAKKKVKLDGLQQKWS